MPLENGIILTTSFMPWIQLERRGEEGIEFMYLKPERCMLSRSLVSYPVILLSPTLLIHLFHPFSPLPFSSTSVIPSLPYPSHPTSIAAAQRYTPVSCTKTFFIQISILTHLRKTQCLFLTSMTW
jgi:hypothetical protein